MDEQKAQIRNVKFPAAREAHKAIVLQNYI